MDSVITAAARALTGGDPLGALNRVALRDDPPALALRGIALAQLGDLSAARPLLRQAAKAFGAREPLARARCVLAEAEVALAGRELHDASRSLDAAHRTLERHGDTLNAAHARLLAIRYRILIGRLDDAERQLQSLAPEGLPFALRTTLELSMAGIALRRLDTATARSALVRAEQAARQAGIAALIHEVETTADILNRPAARSISRTGERPLRLDEVEALLNSRTLVVDACRYSVRQTETNIALNRRPILFTLARALAQAWPGDAGRDALIAQAFRIKHTDDTHRARLRVEIGRLRKALRPLASIEATNNGFALRALHSDQVVVLARPVEEKHAPVLALLSDGEAWSSSALALALNTSQRTVQRALDALAEDDKVKAIGDGRARRWVAAPVLGFTTTLLLTAPVPGG